MVNGTNIAATFCDTNFWRTLFITSGCWACVSRTVSFSGRPSTPPAALISATASCWPRCICWPSPAYTPVTGTPEPMTIGCLLVLAAAAAGAVLSEARPPKNPATPPTTSPPAPAAPTPRRKSLRVTPGWLRVTLG